MRILLAELAPARGDVERNLRRLERIVAAAEVDLTVFPELFLSGYLVGDRIHQLAVDREGPEVARISEIARRHRRAVVVGAPLRHAKRRGEVENAALLADGVGTVSAQVKRFLPAFGPFEEGQFYTPTRESRPLAVGEHAVGFEVCYDAFFPEVTRDLALGGAELFVNVSASPVTSRTLFERVLPARAVENAVPVVYVNRVGVEDGIVFGGGSAAWDARGGLRSLTPWTGETLGAEEHLWTVDLDLQEGPRWRPFRPVLRDLSRVHPEGRPSAPSATPGPDDLRVP